MRSSASETRRQEHLPPTHIETDSYLAVQLIEKQKEVSFASLGRMAEALEGNFTFTVLDQRNHLFFVKGNNPLAIYHYPEIGLYLYASTMEILDTAAGALNMQMERMEVIQPRQGDILRIDRKGLCNWGRFDDAKLCAGWYDPAAFLHRGHSRINAAQEDSYISELRSVAWAYGCAPEVIDRMISRGFQPEEIEELLVGNYHYEY